MEMFEKNLQFYKKRFPEAAELITSYLAENPDRDENVYSNEEFAAVVVEDRPWYLTSRYDAKAAADIWASQFKSDDNRIYIMYGFGNGTYLNALLDRLPESSAVIVYEPDPEIFLKAFMSVDFEKLFRNRTVLVADGINPGHLYEYFIGNVTYENHKRIYFCVHPEYDKLYPEKADWIRNVCTNEIAMLALSRNTELLYSNEFFENMMRNLCDLVGHSGLVELKKAMEKLDKKDFPAVIVAAGPSLNNNIAQLKEYKNKAFIIACDSALNPLLKNGIIPDISVSLDSHKPLDLFARPEVKEIPFVVCLQSVTWFRDYHTGKKFYFADNKMAERTVKKYGKDMPYLESGGSVANNAFSLAKYLGFTKMILIGQDLAYSNGKYYASGVHEGEDKDFNSKFASNPKYFKVEGYYGDQVYTEHNLNLYRVWFEKQIVRYPNISVMNCTQGGAKINGAEQIDLKDALERECKNECDFKALIEASNELFTQEQLQSIYKDFANYDAELDDISKDIKEGVDKYRRLEELMRKGKTSTSEFKRYFERINEIQKRVEDEPLMDLAALHNRVTEYEVLDEEMDSDNEIENGVKAIRSGIKMLESYKYGIDKVKEALPILNEQLEKFAK